MAAAMARQKNQLQITQAANDEGIRRLAEGRGYALFAYVLKPRQLVKTAAADNAENGCPHAHGGNSVRLARRA